MARATRTKGTGSRPARPAQSFRLMGSGRVPVPFVRAMARVTAAGKKLASIHSLSCSVFRLSWPRARLVKTAKGGEIVFFPKLCDAVGG